MSVPTILRASTVTPTGDIESTIDLALLGEPVGITFDRDATIAGIADGSVRVVLPDDFALYGAPNVTAHPDNVNRIVIHAFNARSPQAIAARKANVIAAIDLAYDAEDPLGTLAEMVRDGDLDLRVFIDAANMPAKQGRGKTDHVWVIGQTYVNGDDVMTYPRPATFVVNGDQTFTSASAAARYVAATRDGHPEAADTDSKYSRSGKAFWK